MTIHDSVLQSSEKIMFALRGLYLACGYRPYRMSKFEEYDLYAGNKDFLVSDHVITFNDTDGKLLALKPDVTLSIIKNSADCPEETNKVFYNENVYRVSKGSGSFKEIMQTGVECFGKVGEDEICQVLMLAGQSLQLLPGEGVLAISDLGVLSSAVEAIRPDREGQKQLYEAIGERNFARIGELCGDADPTLLYTLLSLGGSASEALQSLESAAIPGCERLREVLRRLSVSPVGELLHVDFSVTGDVGYYNGIIFKGFLRDIPEAVLSGGQYDSLMRKMGRKSCAIGFAVYTDLLDRLSLTEEKAPDRFLNVAFPKGRLGEKIYELFAAAGYECPALLDPGRKLIFENAEKGVRYFWVKPSDVAIYVERGAADVGVAGKDILLEYAPDVYELLDTGKGKCRMAVAAPNGFADSGEGTLRVATKFANIAKRHYRAKGRDIDIIHLNGSIEIAPILGLSDVIVDIVETGSTLRENDLEVVEDVLPISARLIANKASYKFKSREIETLVKGIAAALEEEK